MAIPVTKRRVRKRSVFRSIVIALFLTLVAMGGLLSAQEPVPPSQPLALPVPQLGYGLFFAYGVDSAVLNDLGFNYSKGFGGGDGTHVHLTRLWADWYDYEHQDQFRQEIRNIVLPHVNEPVAYEIGNEPNLDWAWSEGAPGIQNPDPAKYTTLLKIAYQEIKAIDPDATVVAAGMATVGPASPTQQPWAYPQAWNDLMFVQAMYDHGAKGYFDAMGGHPYGFAYEPERDPTEPTVNGLAFRRMEQLHQVMAANGDGDTPVWGTEWGWLIRRSECESQWRAEGRWWQVVSEQQQADYLVRAFQYAEAHWPWMGPLFVNYDYARAKPNCDALSWYGIINADGAHRPAYDALKAMPKGPVLSVEPDTLAWMQQFDQRKPISTTVRISNAGAGSFNWTLAVDQPWVSPSDTSGVAGAQVTLTVDPTGLAMGTHEATVTVTADEGVYGSPHEIQLRLFLVPMLHQVFLPIVHR